MDSSEPAASGSGGRNGRVLSGGPRAQGRSDLGPASLWWEPGPGHPTAGTGAFFPRGLPGAPDRPRMEVGADMQPFRCSPVLVAYPRPGGTSAGPNAYYLVLGGRAHLNPDDAGTGAFRPAPDLVFTLGVELPGAVAERLGHSAAATSVFRGAPGNCRRPRLLSLVGSRPRLALSQLGQQLLSWKEFPPCNALSDETHS